MNSNLPLSFHDAKFCTIRLKPGDDLLHEIRILATTHNIKAGFIASSVGSLSQFGLRYAGKPDATIQQGCYEIVSLIGTIETTGEHIHLSVSDENGAMLGGHVMEGCIVRTTLEIVIGILDNCQYSREHCDLSGYDELIITSI